MSIETVEQTELGYPVRDDFPELPLPEKKWESLAKKLLKDAESQSAKAVLGKSTRKGGVYRWGIAAATGAACDELTELLSRIAYDPSGKHQLAELDLVAEADSFLNQFDGLDHPSPLECARAVLWAAALPGLTAYLDQQRWWCLLTTLESLRESVLERGEASSPAYLMIGGELGLTLAWRLAELKSCRRLRTPGFQTLSAWCNQGDDALQSAAANGIYLRLILASLERCQQIVEHTSKRRLGSLQVETVQELASWAIAMTYHTGATGFSAAQRAAVSDDLGRHGLLARAAAYEPESLEPALAAALGARQTGGRLTWEFGLPDSLHHSPDGKIAVFFPDWDVRRGRVHLDYSGEEVRTEIFAGKSQVISGVWQTMIQVDGAEQHPSDDWSEVCEFTDDDVHYIEIEQAWTGGLTLQRQFLLIRDDRCLLVADAVLPSSNFHEASQSISYSCRIPLADSIEAEAESETREFYLSDGRQRGLVLPISAGEWQVGPSDADLKATGANHLLLSSQGVGRLYIPLWFDFQQRRFDRVRTWRQLTVADQLRICDRNEAVGYRVQVGSEHWMVYRSMAEPRCRTVLGKHHIADFYASRFDPSDGDHDALITVDDNDTEDD